VDTQDRFYNEILDMSTKNSSASNTLFSKEKIETLIGGVKQAKDTTKPSGKQRTLLKQCEILTPGNLEKFIKR
jgi:adenylate cyclase